MKFIWEGDTLGEFTVLALLISFKKWVQFDIFNEQNSESLVTDHLVNSKIDKHTQL